MRFSVAGLVLSVSLCTAMSCGARDAARSDGAGQNAASQPAAVQAASWVVLPGGSKIFVEVASEPETRAQGLMFRSSLGRDRGMLFIFPETGVNPFWMKNTLIPLDILWIDEGRKIVHIAPNMLPCKADPCPSHSPGKEARYVLELAAGEVAARGLAEGDSLVFEGVENIVAH